MQHLDSILRSISRGARLKIGTDYFGQPLVMVPRRWLPGTKRVRLTAEEMDVVRNALIARRNMREMHANRTERTSPRYRAA